MQKKHLTKFNTFMKNNKIGIGGNYLNITQAMYEKPTADVIMVKNGRLPF